MNRRQNEQKTRLIEYKMNSGQDEQRKSQENIKTSSHVETRLEDIKT